MFQNLTRLGVFQSRLALLFFLLLPAASFGQQANSGEPAYIQTIPDPSALSEVQRIAKIENQLKTSRAMLDIQCVPLTEVAERLSAQLGIHVRLNHRALNDVGLASTTPITFQLSEVPTETLLRLLLKQLDLTFLIEAEGLVFTTPEEAEKSAHTRFYNIEEIIPGPNRDYNSIMELISTSIEPESWEEGTGPSTIAPYQNGIVLYQTSFVHQKIEGLLAMLREAKSLPANAYSTKALTISPSGFASASIHDRLRRVKVQFEEGEQSILEVSKAFEKQTSAAFYIDHRALEDVGLSDESKVNLSLGEITVHHALNVMGEQLDLAWYTMGEVIVITTPEEAENELEVRVYPIRDLTWSGLNPAAQEVRELLDATQAYYPRYFGGGFGYTAWDQTLSDVGIPELPGPKELLVDAIQSNVEPESWGHLGGPGTINYFQAADCLVISQSYQIHQQIAELLQTIRDDQKPHDLNELAEKVRQVEETSLIMFYSVPRDRQGKSKLTREDLTTIAGRIQTLFGKGTWDQDSHFIDITQNVLVIRHRRDVQRQIRKFWSHLGPDESNHTTWQNNPGTGNHLQPGFGGGGFNNTGNRPSSLLPMQPSAPVHPESHSGPIQPSGGIF